MISPGGRTKLALRMNRRKTVSVTPAIGARIVAGAMRILPIWREFGTRAPCGATVALAGFSQNLRMTSIGRGFRHRGLTMPETSQPLSNIFSPVESVLALSKGEHEGSYLPSVRQW